jgi:hypothetical protein
MDEISQPFACAYAPWRLRKAINPDFRRPQPSDLLLALNAPREQQIA